jgi:predicted metal-binding protein
MIEKITHDKIEYNKKFQYLCKHPFYGHQKGCPNYGKKRSCPPHVPLIDEVLELNKGLYLIFTEFNVGEFAERIRKSHPDWKSSRQWYNSRYWQPKARKLQRKEEAYAKREKSIDCIINNPEALGVNVSRLMAVSGINLKWEWPPEHEIKNKGFLGNTVYLVSLGGYSKK